MEGDDIIHPGAETVGMSCATLKNSGCPTDWVLGQPNSAGASLDRPQAENEQIQKVFKSTYLKYNTLSVHVHDQIGVKKEIAK